MVVVSQLSRVIRREKSCGASRPEEKTKLGGKKSKVVLRESPNARKSETIEVLEGQKRRRDGVLKKKKKNSGETASENSPGCRGETEETPGSRHGSEEKSKKRGKR